MHGKQGVYQQIQHQAIGEMIDAEAALGPDPHPAIRSWVTGNAAAAGLLRAMIDVGVPWQLAGLRELLDQLEGPDTPAPSLATVSQIGPFAAAANTPDQETPSHWTGPIPSEGHPHCVICQSRVHVGDGYTIGTARATWYVHGICHRIYPEFEFGHGVGVVAPQVSA